MRFLAVMMGFFIITSLACRNRDKRAEVGSTRDISRHSIYFDYQVTGEEDNDTITVLLQFRSWGPNGATLTLDSPSRVLFDGQLLKGNTAKITGSFYEIQRPLSTFTGLHTIEFFYNAEYQFKDQFFFRPMGLSAEIPAILPRDSLHFLLSGIDSGDMVRAVLTDTVFGSEGIDRLDTVQDGQITIGREELEGLAEGPIQVQLVKESEVPIKNKTSIRGRIYTTFRLKREFLLTR